MRVKPEDIMALIELFETSQWDELHVEINGLQLFLSTDPNAWLATGPVQPLPAVTRAPATEAAPTPPAPAALPAATMAQAPAAETVPAHWMEVVAPNLGTFYRAPKPGAAPFVEIGQRVEPETELCLLEVMKLFTAVRAGVAGVVRRICVKDGEMVEHGQALFLIEPA